MSSFTKAATWVGKTNEEYSVTTRAAGAAQAVFGAIGFAGAVGGAILTAPTGIGLVGFGALAAIELDQAVAGVRTAWTGEYQTSYIAEGISNVTGINAEYADVGLGFAGVTTSVVAGGKATLRWIGSGKAVNVNDFAHIPKIRGRAPINSKYAGQVHPSGVRFTEQGFPDFRPYAKAEVGIEGLTGVYRADEVLANAAVGLKRTPDGFVWHHVEDGYTMQLIPQATHDAARHTGGAAVIRNGGFD